MILVGDSLGMVNLGYDSTLPVTVEDVVHHTAAVSRGVDSTFLCADVPFLGTAESRSRSVRIARRLMQEGGAQSIKIEGGERNLSIIDHLTDFDVPVLGHLGLTPQSIEALGEYRLRAVNEQEIKTLVKNALELEECGVLAIVLECIPAPVAKEVTNRLEIPTIGIGAGGNCSGQVLVWQDMMGLNPDETPKFVKSRDNFYERLRDGVQEFCEEVRNRKFPAPENAYGLPEEISEDEVLEWVESVE